MAKINLNIDAKANDAKKALDDLKKYANSLFGAGQKIDLGIDPKTATAIAKAANALASLQRAQNQAAAASAKTAQAEAKATAETAKYGQQIEKTKQATERTVQSANKLAAAQEKTAQTTNQLATAQERTVQTQERTTQAKERTTQAELRLQTEQEKTNRAMMGGVNAADALAVALGNIAARAFHLVISKITQSLREAVSTMKDVDTQLTNISKVSGITGQALADMGERAYETASKYGVSADEFLSSVYTFQKAGLGPSAEAMGELAVKTMLVGDTTADVASKFLISANAAWKFGGDMERLSQIVDEADYINNNYATDLQKLSEGLPRVASVAAQAGMSAEETLAAIGTITAVTQESGTKSATALRALILNIEGQIGEFVDETGESFKVTEESVKSLQGLMEKYAKAELDAARASGELINPMTAIKALFEGMANSDLNDQDLFALLSGMGGKLRTNQLTALVQNYELFGEMLDKIANSAGTADNEISLMMDSWERKTQVLKNTWTEFVADIVDTDTIKGAIGTLTDIVSWLDERVDRFKNPFFDSEKTQEEINSLQKEYDVLVAKGDNLTTVEKTRLEYLEKQLEVLNLQQEAEERAAAKKLQKQLTGIDERTQMRVDEQNLTLYGKQSGEIQYAGDLSEYTNSLKDLNAEWSKYYGNLLSVREAGEQLTESQEEFIKLYEDNNIASKAVDEQNELVNGYHVLVDAQGQIVAYEKDHTDELEDQKSKWEEVLDNLNGVKDGAEQIPPEIKSAETEAESFAAALKQAANNVYEIQRNLDSLAFPQFGFASGTKNAPGGPTLVNELGPELISENGKAYIANGGAPAVVNLSRGAVVLTADETKSALKGGMPIHAAVRGADGAGIVDALTEILGAITGSTDASKSKKTKRLPTDHGTDTFGAWQCKKCGSWNLGNEKKCTNCGTPKGSNGGGGGGGKGGGSSVPAKSLEEMVKEFNDLLSNLDKQAKLANNQGDYAKEAELYEKAQEAIKKMVDEYRKAGYADDSDEILDLLNKNYDYANKQLTLYQTKWDELIKALDADTAAQDAANKLAEKQQAVEDAREALANAQRQRTTRIYNAATGQWEWVADQKAVSSAQKNLESAEKNYADEVKSQALAELKAMRDTVTDLNNVILGPALSAVVTMAQDSAEFQNFARALNAVFGVGTFLNSTDGNPNAIATTDSHDVIYTFGNVTLTADQAANMSVAELAKMLSVLKLTS